jgi:hypothetical protein
MMKAHNLMYCTVLTEHSQDKPRLTFQKEKGARKKNMNKLHRNTAQCNSTYKARFMGGVEVGCGNFESSTLGGGGKL